jgi:3-isopropylmalate/(R)-2-methylmalate dehydratase small subunit
LFYNWRFDGNDQPNPNFILNDPKYKNSKILVTGENFGCGSSREHAVWALRDYGFSVIVSTSFADIFYSNCFKNGLLAITLDQKIVEKLMQIETEIEIDLENQIIKTNTEEIPFKIDAYKKKNLLEGLDEIALTIQYEDKILEYEKNSNVSSLL